MSLSERELDAIIRRCQRGEDAAYDLLLRAIRSDIRRIILGAIGPDPELEDIIQAAALEVFRSVGRFQRRSKFSTWLYRLVVNVSLQHIRKSQRSLNPVDTTNYANELVADGDSPEKAANIAEQLALAQKVLAEISPKKRVVFMLHEVEGLSPEEISRRLRVSKLTIKSRLFYARKDFYKALRREALLADSRQINDGMETEEN